MAGLLDTTLFDPIWNWLLSNASGILVGVIVSTIAGFTGWWVRQQFHPKLDVVIWPHNLVESEALIHYNYWQFPNRGRATAHKVKATMRIDSPEGEEESEDGTHLVHHEGKTKTFILFKDEEMPTEKAEKAVRAVGFSFVKGEKVFRVDREVTRQTDDGVVETQEVPEEFPAYDSSVTISLEGENLREKDTAVRRFKVEFKDGEPYIRPVTGNENKFMRRIGL